MTQDLPAAITAGKHCQAPGELAVLPGDGIDELRAQSRRRHRGIPRPNLTMLDAY